MADFFTIFGGRIKLINSSYKPTEDPLWLASIINNVHNNAKVLDAGCGTGAISLALAIKFQEKNIKITGVELQERHLNIAVQNFCLNNFNHNIFTPVNADFLKEKQTMHNFDLVVSNPPFYSTEKGFSSNKKQVEHGLSNEDIYLWAKKMISLTQKGGEVVLLQHASQEKNILPLFKNLKHKVFYLKSSETKPAKRIIIQAKNTKGTLEGTSIIKTYDEKIRKIALGG